MTTIEQGERLPGGDSGAPSGSGASELSLVRIPLALLDRWMPARPPAFLAVVAAISAVVWLAGLGLAADRARFLASRDWQIQPLYLAAHFVLLRLFVTAYAGNFVAGCRMLTIEPAEARRSLEVVLSGLGWIAAMALAAPFVWYDLKYLASPEFIEAGESSGSDGALCLADWLLGTVWTVEWVINAYVWVLILGFLGMTMRVLKRFGFRESIGVVLAERHYRPFLMMSAQGASIVLGFSIVSGIYVWHAEGEATDYLGLWITAGLLLVGFVPPWLRLKNAIARKARSESDRLNREIEAGLRAHDGGGGARGDRLEWLGEKVSLLLTMARAGHLERLYRDLGRNEGQAMLIRLLAPLSTVVWKIFRPG